MERLVRGARHDAIESLLGGLPVGIGPGEAEAGGQPGRSKRRNGILSLKADVGAATLENILAAGDRLAFVDGLDLPIDIWPVSMPVWLGSSAAGSIVRPRPRCAAMATPRLGLLRYISCTAEPR